MIKRNKVILLMIAAIIGIAILTYATNSKDAMGSNGENSEVVSNTSDDGKNTKSRGNKRNKGNSKNNSNNKIGNKSKNTSTPPPPSGLELPKYGDNDMIVTHTGFTLSYNKKHNTPNWVAWCLTANHADGLEQRSQKFWADEKIPTAYRVDYYDYKGSGYDRGHMCPAGDMKWSREAMHDCFYMSNMCPQDRSLNSGSWRKLEDACRRWAITEGAVYIACGPVYRGKNHEVIGIDHAVEVPEGFFKVVLSLRKGHEKAIGFYYDNNDRTQQMSKTCTSVDAIEEMTGYDFFYQLDDKIENRLEATYTYKDWR